MAYHIEITYTNGYRCSCCLSEWERSRWVDTLEEALEQVPTELRDGEPHPYNGDMETRRITITDGSNGEEIAWASLDYPIGYTKPTLYSFTRWSGYRPDIGSFEVVYDRNGCRIERTWDDIIQELDESRRARELKEAQRELEKAQKKIASLTNG